MKEEIKEDIETRWNAMRFLFIVQGEGRGHMTQAISLKQMLENNGHEVCAVCVGRSQSRTIPRFFLDKMGSSVIPYDSPNFKTDPQRRGVSIFGTALDNLRRLPLFARSLRTLHRTVSVKSPDLIVNFFDPLAAIYGTIYSSKPKMEEFRNWVDSGVELYPQLFRRRAGSSAQH
jgi:UDP:flavonoid glycosyltransferase YjiC (YdhE family)